MRLTLISVVLLFGLTTVGQTQHPAAHMPTNAIYYKWLLGRWRSDEDKRWERVFNFKKCIDLYDHDPETISHSRYFLSTSCEEKDSLQRQAFTELDNLHDIFLVILDEEDTVCHRIENLDPSTLSYTNGRSGKVNVFTKIRKAQKKIIYKN